MPLNSVLGITQGHWKWYQSINQIRCPMSLPLQL